MASLCCLQCLEKCVLNKAFKTASAVVLKNACCPVIEMWIPQKLVEVF
jgi:hypothetical protein